MSMVSLSSCGITAVDINRLAGDKTRRRRREKNQNTDYVFDLTEPADRGAIAHALIKLRLGADEFAIESGDDDGGADRVHGDAGGAELKGERGAEIRQAGFAGAIGRTGGHAATREDRAHVDDAAVLAFDHRRRKRARTEKCAGEINIVDAPPFVERHIGEEFWRGYSGIVEQNVGAAEFARHTIAGAFDLRFVGDVGFDHQRAAPGFLYRSRGRIELLHITANEREIGAGFR